MKKLSLIISLIWIFIFQYCSPILLKEQSTAMDRKNPVWISDSINSPPEAKKYFSEAFQKAQSENYNEAIMNFTKAIEIYPNFAYAYYFRGIIKLNLKQEESGCNDLNRAGELGLIEAYKIVNKIRKRQFWEQMVIHL